MRSHLQRKWRMQVSNKKKEKKKPSTSETRRDAFIYKQFWRSLLLLLSCFGILAAFISAVWCNFRHLKVPPFFFFREGGRRKSRGLHITPFSFQPLSRRCAQQPEALFLGVFLLCAGALLYPSEEPRRVVLTRLHTFTSKREKRAKKVKKRRRRAVAREVREGWPDKGPPRKPQLPSPTSSSAPHWAG